MLCLLDRSTRATPFHRRWNGRMAVRHDASCGALDYIPYACCTYTNFANFVRHLAVSATLFFSTNTELACIATCPRERTPSSCSFPITFVVNFVYTVQKAYIYSSYTCLTRTNEPSIEESHFDFSRLPLHPAAVQVSQRTILPKYLKSNSRPKLYFHQSNCPTVDSGPLWASRGAI